MKPPTPPTPPAKVAAERNDPKVAPPTPRPGAHPHRLEGTHDGMFITSHHRGAKKKP